MCVLIKDNHKIDFLFIVVNKKNITSERHE